MQKCAFALLLLCVLSAAVAAHGQPAPAARALAAGTRAADSGCPRVAPARRSPGLPDCAILSLIDFGAVGDGVSDDSPAFLAADASGRDILIPAGTYLIKSSLTLSADYSIQRGALLQPASGSTITFTRTPQAGLFQVFSPQAGAISFATPPEVYPEWWGASPTTTQSLTPHDDSPALAAACASLPLNTLSEIKTTYSGALARIGTIKFRSMWYHMSRPFVCSFGVSYTNGDAPGSAILELDHNARVPGPETFVFMVDPPFAPRRGIATNTSFGTRIKGIRTWAAGTPASGLFVTLTQGSSIQNAGAGYSNRRGCVILMAQTASVDILDCASTQNGPAVTLIGSGDFSFLNVGNVNRKGLLGQIEFPIPAKGAFTIPAAGSVGPGESYVQVIRGNGSTFPEGESPFPIRYLTLVTGAPAQGQYSQSNGELVFNPADSGTLVRLIYHDTTPITLDNPRVKPVPSIQVEALSSIHIGRVFCEGVYDCINTFQSRALQIDNLEIHPSAEVGPRNAAVYLDENTSGADFRNVQIFDASNAGGTGRFGVSINDQAARTLRPMVNDKLFRIYTYDTFTQKRAGDDNSSAAVSSRTPDHVDSSGKLTIAPGSTNSGTITFGSAYKLPPACIVQPQNISPPQALSLSGFTPQVTSTTLSIVVGNAPRAEVVFAYHCFPQI